MAVILRQRRDSAANWTAENPVIPDGQLCFDETNNTYRIGDGILNYESLPLQSGSVGPQGEIGATGPEGAASTVPGPEGPAVPLNNTLTSTSTTEALTAAQGKVLQDSKLPIVQSSYNQIADASPSSGTYTFNMASGDMQQITAAGNFTLAFSNFPSGKVATVIIDAINWGSKTITFPVGMIFDSKTAPTFTAAGLDRLMVVKDKDGIYGLFVIGEDVGTA